MPDFVDRTISVSRRFFGGVVHWQLDATWRCKQDVATSRDAEKSTKNEAANALEFYARTRSPSKCLELLFLLLFWFARVSWGWVWRRRGVRRFGGGTWWRRCRTRLYRLWAWRGRRVGVVPQPDAVAVRGAVALPQDVAAARDGAVPQPDAVAALHAVALPPDVATARDGAVPQPDAMAPLHAAALLLDGARRPVRFGALPRRPQEPDAQVG